MDEYRTEAKKLWNSNPCGAQKSLPYDYGTLEFFEEVRRKRYQTNDKWVIEEIPFAEAKGKKILEIGFGLGTDLLTFVENGAEVYGIDITEEHYKLAKENFKLHNKTAEIKLCDASAIEFESNYFDMVYSNGVLHHVPDTVRCISEAYRVLKPGGLFILTLYYRYSAFHILTMLFYRGILQNKLKQLGYEGLMSTIENGADGVNIKPLVKTYSKSEIKNILSDFHKVDLKNVHFQREHVPFLGRLIPRALERPLTKYFGWYVLAFAIK